MNISFWREATFRQQLILVIVLGVSFLVIAASVLSAHIGGKRFADAVMQQGMANAQQLAQDSSLALIYESRQDAERVVQSAFAFNGTLVAELYSEDLRRLAARSLDSVSLPPFQRRNAASGAYLEAETGDYWIFVCNAYIQASETPFDNISPKAKELGYVRIAQSKAGLKKIRSDIFIASIFAAALIGLPVFLLAILIIKKLTDPLSKLSAVMVQAHNGHTNIRARLSGSRDIRQMSDDFNAMMAQLEDVRSGLENKVKDRTTALAALAASLELFNERAVHELRGPMSVISGAAGLIEIKASNVAEIQHYLDRIKTEIGRINHMMEALRAMSRLELTTLEKKSVNLAPIARYLAETLPTALPERQIAFVIADEIPAYCSPDLLTIVLSNLISNAIKFSRDDVPTRIEIGRDEKGYFVRDNGLGFDPRHADMLFTIFGRLENADQVEGSGIGLATAYLIITRHSGRIWAESLPGQGASFYFTLPNGD